MKNVLNFKIVDFENIKQAIKTRRNKREISGRKSTGRYKICTKRMFDI